MSKLIEDKADGQYCIEGYDEDSIRVNGETLTKSFIVSPERLLNPWECPAIGEFTPHTLAPLLEFSPDLILLGTGSQPAFLPPNVMQSVLGQRIGLEVMTNASACRTYAVLQSEGRNFVAGFVLR